MARTTRDASEIRGMIAMLLKEAETQKDPEEFQLIAKTLRWALGNIDVPGSYIVDSLITAKVRYLTCNHCGAEVEKLEYYLTDFNGYVSGKEQTGLFLFYSCGNCGSERFIPWDQLPTEPKEVKEDA